MLTAANSSSNRYSPEFTLKVRYPGWVKTRPRCLLCVTALIYAASASPRLPYVTITRTWSNNDAVEIKTPMHVSIEELPNVPEYIAVMYGPYCSVPHRNRTPGRLDLQTRNVWINYADGPLFSLTEAPIIVGEREEILEKLNNMQAVPGKNLAVYCSAGFIRYLKKTKTWYLNLSSVSTTAGI